MDTTTFKPTTSPLAILLAEISPAAPAAVIYSRPAAARPGFAELMPRVDRGGIDILVVADLTRLGRDTKVRAEILDWISAAGLKLMTLDQDWVDLSARALFQRAGPCSQSRGAMANRGGATGPGIAGTKPAALLTRTELRSIAPGPAANRNTAPANLPPEE